MLEQTVFHPFATGMSDATTFVVASLIARAHDDARARLGASLFRRACVPALMMHSASAVPLLRLIRRVDAEHVNNFETLASCI